MQKFQQGALALLMAGCITFYSCGPNDDSGGMDQKNSDGEGEVDSTRLTNFDSSSASVTVPYLKPTVKTSNSTLSEPAVSVKKNKKA